MILAVVKEARLSHPGAAEYLARVILERRDKTVRWGITATNPLDRFALRDGTAPELTFDNAAVRLHLVTGADVRYTVRWTSYDNQTGKTRPVGTAVEGSAPRATVPPDAWGPADASGIRYAAASIETSHPQFPHWVQPVVVTVRNRGGMLDVVGIDRPTDWAGTTRGRRDVTKAN
jgi:hypothetical protein